MVEHEIEEAEVVVDVCSGEILAGDPEEERVEEGVVVCEGLNRRHFGDVARAGAGYCGVEGGEPFR